MTQQKVIEFPKRRIQRREKTDEDLVEDVRKAYRKLRRTIDAARSAGITIEINLSQPIFTKKL